MENAVLSTYKIRTNVSAVLEIEECVECLSSEMVIKEVGTKPKCVTTTSWVRPSLPTEVEFAVGCRQV